MREKTDNYILIIEDLRLQHFTEAEIEFIRNWVFEQSFNGVMYHVRAQNGRTIYVPPELAENVLEAVSGVVKARYAERVLVEKRKNQPESLVLDSPPAPEGSSEEWLASKGINLEEEEEPEVELSEDEKAENLAELKTLGLETDD